MVYCSSSSTTTRTQHNGYYFTILWLWPNWVLVMWSRCAAQTGVLRLIVIALVLYVFNPYPHPLIPSPRPIHGLPWDAGHHLPDVISLFNAACLYATCSHHLCVRPPLKRGLTFPGMWLSSSPYIINCQAATIRYSPLQWLAQPHRSISTSRSSLSACQITISSDLYQQ